MSAITFLQKFGPARRVIFKLGESRSQKMLKGFEGYLKPGENLLDVGSGTGNMDILLAQAGYKITPLDVQNLSFSDKIQPIIYDGRHMPFKDNEFGAALMLTVLHHIENPETVLREAARVAKRLIIIEEVKVNVLQTRLMFLLDNLLNLEFRNNPHSNRTDEQWKAIFKKINLQFVTEKSLKKELIVFRRKLYIVEK